MAVSATVNQNTRITANVDSTTSAGPKKVSVTQPAATQSQKLNLLSDVNVTTLNAGAVLQYDDTTTKWTSTNDLVTDNGNLVLNAGNF
tara:strand:- start:898 stop:1161 length:264 start_codon:yes stop_codon:yes gene_type:complete